MKIQGNVAIVTGGAQGIGEKICTALLDRGCKVKTSMREFFTVQIILEITQFSFTQLIFGISVG